MIFGAKCEKPRALSVFVSFLVLVLRQREVQLNLDVGGVGRQAEGRGSQTRQVEEDPGARRPSKRHSRGSVRHCGEMHVPQPSSADGSVALTTSTVLCNHRHCDLVFLIVANRNSVPIKLQVPILPSPSPSLRRPASVNARSPGVPGKRTHTRRRLLASGAYCPRGSPTRGGCRHAVPFYPMILCCTERPHLSFRSPADGHLASFHHVAGHLE